MRTLFLVFLIGFLFIVWSGQTQSDTSSESVIALTKNDLAARLNVPVNQVEMVNIVSVTWENACLGVHSPGFICAQVTTPGYVISLRVNGKTYVYHTNHVQAMLTN